MVPLKYPGNFWRTLEIHFIKIQMTCSKRTIPETGTAANQVPKFEITNAKLYVPVVTLSTQDNIELLK